MFRQWFEPISSSHGLDHCIFFREHKFLHSNVVSQSAVSPSGSIGIRCEKIWTDWVQIEYFGEYWVSTIDQKVVGTLSLWTLYQILQRNFSNSEALRRFHKTVKTGSGDYTIVKRDVRNLRWRYRSCDKNITGLDDVLCDDFYDVCWWLLGVMNSYCDVFISSW